MRAAALPLVIVALVALAGACWSLLVDGAPGPRASVVVERSAAADEARRRPPAQHRAPPVSAGDGGGGERAPLLSGFVVDERGPVGDAEVRLLAAPPAPDACDDDDDDETEPAMRRAAYAHCRERFRAALARCHAVTRTRAIAVSDDDGWIAFDDDGGADDANAVEIESERGMLWEPLPPSASAGEVSFELAAAVTRRVELPSGDDAPGIRIALFYPSGHCVELERAAGASSWATAAPVPATWALLYVDVPGHIPLTRAWRDEGDAPLMRLHTVDEDESLAAHDDDDDGDDGDDDGGDGDGDGDDGDDDHEARAEERTCTPISVVDADGAAVPQAMVSARFQWMGSVAFTDDDGHVCLTLAPQPGELEVAAPRRLGGPCAASVKLPLPALPEDSGDMLEPRRWRPPLHVELPFATPALVAWRGQVTSPEGIPVAGARVVVADIVGAGGCPSSTTRSSLTGPDGRFTLTGLPVGTASVRVLHRWFAPLAVDVTLAEDSEPAALVVERGARWRIRVVDAERGSGAYTCVVVVNAPLYEETSQAVCSSDGFTLTGLPVGVDVVAQVEALGAFGRLVNTRTVRLIPGESRVDDIVIGLDPTLARSSR